METTVILPAAAEDLSTLSGFFKRYFQLLPYHKNGEDAYVQLEKEYFEKFGQKKYKTYFSFKSARSYFYNTKYR